MRKLTKNNMAISLTPKKAKKLLKAKRSIKKIKRTVKEDEDLTVQKESLMDATLMADLDAAIQKNAAVVPADGLDVVIKVPPTTPVTETTHFAVGQAPAPVTPTV